LISRKSCPTTKSSVLSASGNNEFVVAKSHSSGITNGSKSRSSSNAYKGDRFIPFRGTQENFFEEFMINNEVQRESKRNKTNAENNSEQVNIPTSNNIANLAAMNSNYSSNSSNNSSGMQYAKGSGHKKKQSFAELITESLFTNRRGSPNTVSQMEAEEELLRTSKSHGLGGGKSVLQE
jgi:hypothetical protein